MAQAVHKYEVPGGGEFTDVPMPIGAQILHADVQGEQVYVWALVDPEEVHLINRRLGWFGTGRWITGRAKYLGTCIERNFGLVWHVFEEEGA